MRNRFLLTYIVMLSLLISCGRQRTVETLSGFSIIRDTVILNTSTWRRPTSILGLTHAVKHNGYYYCYFDDPGRFGNKYRLLAISMDLSKAWDIELPQDGVTLFDFFEFRDSLYAQGHYAADNSYVFDDRSSTWLQRESVPGIVYEDADWVAFYEGCGEWGTFTWLRNRVTGQEYLYPIPAHRLHRVGNTFYWVNPVYISRDEVPLKGLMCDSTLYYDHVIDGIPKGWNRSLQIAKRVVIGAGHKLSRLPLIISLSERQYDEDGFRDPNTPAFVGSFVTADSLYVIVNTKHSTLLSKVQGDSLFHAADFGRRYRICEDMRQNDGLLLRYIDDDDEDAGLIDIDTNHKEIRFIHLTSNLKTCQDESEE